MKNEDKKIFFSARNPNASFLQLFFLLYMCMISLHFTNGCKHKFIVLKKKKPKFLSTCGNISLTLVGTED